MSLSGLGESPSNSSISASIESNAVAASIAVDSSIGCVPVFLRRLSFICGILVKISFKNGSSLVKDRVPSGSLRLFIFINNTSLFPRSNLLDAGKFLPALIISSTNSLILSSLISLSALSSTYLDENCSIVINSSESKYVSISESISPSTIIESKYSPRSKVSEPVSSIYLRISVKIVSGNSL